MRTAIAPGTVSLLLMLAVAAGCGRPSSNAPEPPAGSSPASKASSAPESARDAAFRQKVACADAARAFAFSATSPRNHPYVAKRNCYSSTLNTCIVEYVALDESATIFDALTTEPLVEYLNHPGPADRLNLSPRVEATPPAAAAAATATSEGVTQQRIDFGRWSSHLFESCAK